MKNYDLDVSFFGKNIIQSWISRCGILSLWKIERSIPFSNLLRILRDFRAFPLKRPHNHFHNVFEMKIREDEKINLEGGSVRLRETSPLAASNK